jgi:hypothetical protein
VEEEHGAAGASAGASAGGCEREESPAPDDPKDADWDGTPSGKAAAAAQPRRGKRAPRGCAGGGSEAFGVQLNPDGCTFTAWALDAAGRKCDLPRRFRSSQRARAQAALEHRRAMRAAAPAAHRFLGVRKAAAPQRWTATAVAGAGSGAVAYQGTYDTPAAAARAVDAARRAAGKLRVNFPRPGTAEVPAGARPHGKHARAPPAARTAADTRMPSAAAAAVAPAAAPPPPPAAQPVTPAAGGGAGAPPAVLAAAAAAPGDASSFAHVEAFMRAIAPPLRQLDAILAAMRCHALDMTQLRDLAAEVQCSDELRPFEYVARECLNMTLVDRAHFLLALKKLPLAH